MQSYSSYSNHDLTPVGSVLQGSVLWLQSNTEVKHASNFTHFKGPTHAI